MLGQLCYAVLFITAGSGFLSARLTLCPLGDLVRVFSSCLGVPGASRLPRGLREGAFGWLPSEMEMPSAAGPSERLRSVIMGGDKGPARNPDRVRGEPRIAKKGISN